MPTEPTPEEEWYKMLTEGEPVPVIFIISMDCSPQIHAANCVARHSKLESMSCTLYERNKLCKVLL